MDRTLSPMRTAVFGLRGRMALYGLHALLVLAAGYPAVRSLVHIWIHDTAFNHGFLIPLVSAWIVYERRALLPDLKVGFSMTGAFGILAAALVYAVGWLLSIQLFQHAAVIGALQAGFLAIFGWQYIRALLFPVAFLAFGIPFGTEAVPMLQAITAWFSINGLRLLGIPVYSDGVMIEVPGGLFQVAEACAGLRFMIATVALGALFAMTAFRSPWRRAAVMALSVAVPILANGARALIMILLGYYSKMTIAVGFDHVIYGYVFLVIVMGLLIALGLAFSDRSMNAPDLTQAALGKIRQAVPGHGGSAPFLAAITIFAAAGAGTTLSDRSSLPRLAVPPYAAPGWTPAKPSENWTPSFPSAQGQRLERLTNGRGGEADLYTAVYVRQREGSELIAFANRLDPEGWVIVERGAVPASRAYPALLYQRQTGPGGAARHVFYTYWTRDGLTVRERDVKIAAARSKLGLDGSTALVALSVEGGERAAALSGIAPLAAPARLDAYIRKTLQTGEAR